MLEDEDALIPLRRAVNLLEASATTTGCQDFGLRMAKVQDINILGPLAVAMQHSLTVAEALRCASRHMYIHSPGFQLSILPHSELVAGAKELRFEVVLPNPPVMRQCMDQCLGDLHHIFRLLARDRYQLCTVTLPHRPTAPRSTYRQFFGATIHAEQGYGSLHVSAATMDASLESVNNSLHQIAMQYLTQNFSGPDRSLSARVQMAVRRTLSSSYSRKTAIANILNMHPRTLQRRLEQENTSFEQLREEVCKQAALRYLRETNVPLAQLAGLIGLSEQSALTRSCKRWFGATPIMIRRGLV